MTNRILAGACLTLGCLLLGVSTWEIHRLTNQAVAWAARAEQQSSGVLSRVDATMAIVQRAASEQEVYYKASGKALAITIARAGHLMGDAKDPRSGTIAALVRGIDKDRDQLSSEIIATVQDSRTTLADFRREGLQAVRDADTTVKAMQPPLEALRANLDEMRPILVELAAVPKATTALLDSAKGAVEGLRPIEANLAEGTASLKEIAKTGDIATRELRQATGKLKAVLKFLGNLVKVNLGR